VKVYKTLANTEDVLRYCEYYNVPCDKIEIATNWDDDVIRIKFKDGVVFYYFVLGDEIIWPPMDISDDPDERIKSCFGKMLKWKIRRSGIPQGEIAKKLGITEATLSRYVTGKAFPKADTLYELSKILNAPVEIF
jgi:DNA-binding XRE family transcriptional regulator